MSLRIRTVNPFVTPANYLGERFAPNETTGKNTVSQKLADARSTDRHNVLIGVRLRRPGETWFTSRISDLSVGGFRLQSFIKLVSGMEIWIMLPGFEGRKATVLWAQEHEAGCAFERPLHPAILDHILRANAQRSTSAAL
ncbi:hypothetical protein BH10PSE12_BH10PSE12_30410 [soil metagenome]